MRTIEQIRDEQPGRVLKTHVMKRTVRKGDSVVLTNYQSYPVAVRRYQSDPMTVLFPGESCRIHAIPKGSHHYTWALDETYAPTTTKP